MITEEEVKKLADLARISLSPEEVVALSKDLESILGYVSELGAVDVGSAERESLLYEHRNVLRSDEAKFQPNQWSEKLVAGAPESRDGFWSVKKILDQSFDA